MTNPTSNFGWQMPTSTDLVTDLPADFAVFGQAVDTSMADLLGGTTGQVLKKNSNTNMDFVWSADSAGMTNPMTTTGDMIYSSSGSTPARLGIGSSGQVVTVAGGVPTWATPASPSTAKTFTLLNAGGTSLSGATTTISGISGIDQIMVIIGDCSTNTSNPNITVLLNSDSGSNYKQAGQDVITTTSTLAAKIDKKYNAANDSIQLGSTPAAADELNAGIMIFGCNTSGVKPFQTTVGISNVANANLYMLNGVYTGSSAITSISIKTSGGSFDKGTIFVYGAA
jgi:hypothetical protein